MQFKNEIRDPVHVFIRVDDDERALIDSWPVQRLRYVHQLALAYLLYPGATHRRFEHSLGVMELAGRVYDVVTDHIPPELSSQFPQAQDPRAREYWRRVIRIAGLCHDIGHLPFSHGAEHELLPDGMSHETLSRRVIEEELPDVLGAMTPPVRPEDVVKLAIGIDKSPDLDRTMWEEILNEIVTGDAFGVDRMDYLLRDSHHLGVAYGRFDHHRLIDTMRILPGPPADPESETGEPSLGAEAGGLQSAEALLMARYFMFSQVYFHRVRQIYDHHLLDFMRAWLTDGYPGEVSRHLELTDDMAFAEMKRAANEPGHPGHDAASRILTRHHFRRLYEAEPAHRRQTPEPGHVVGNAAAAQFGADAIRVSRQRDKGGQVEFPVLMASGDVASSLSVSQVLATLPTVAVDYVYVEPDLHEEADRWLQDNLDRILETGLSNGDGGA